MIFTGIKRKSNQIFLNKKVLEFLKNSKTNSSEKIKSILIILDDITVQDKVKQQILKLFNIPKANLKFVIFQSKINKEIALEEIITPKDFGWYGQIKSEELKGVLTKKYDLLINYSKVDNLYGNLLLLQCNTGFKAGFSYLDNRFYDLLVKCELDNLELFNSELKKYLIILNKL